MVRRKTIRDIFVKDDCRCEIRKWEGLGSMIVDDDLIILIVRLV